MTPTVLIVDDSKLARMSVTKALTALRPEWNRLEAGNADEALAVAQHSRVDVVLVDFNMPGRDGLSLAADLIAVNPAVAVALISANQQQEVVSRARKLGAVFLPKPLQQQALASLLSDLAQQTPSGV